MIRLATLDDLPQLALFALECNAAMQWGGHGLYPDPDSVVETLRELLSGRVEACFLVVEEEGAIVGACAAVINGIAWNRKARIASEWIWHMLPSYPEGIKKQRYFVRMLRIMLAWAKHNNASVFKASCAPEYPSVQKLLERNGIRTMETVCAGGI